MFPCKYFASIFIVLYFFIKSSAGGNHQPNGLEQFFEDQTNFLIKAKLSFEGFENADWLIEESVFGDEKNNIVTSITQENGWGEIKVFRDFKTQTTSLICLQNRCDRYDTISLWHQVTNSWLAEYLKRILLMGPYRIISYFANEPTNEVEKNGLQGFRRLRLKFDFSDPNSKILIRRKNPGQITLLIGVSSANQYIDPHLTAVLSIIQIEPLQSSMVPLPPKYIHYKFSESFTRHNGSKIYKTTTNHFIITHLDPICSLEIIGERPYRGLIHDYKFGLKYTSGFNECTVELSNKKINYMTSKRYGIEFVKELYFPESAVESFSFKLGMKAEYNKLIDNVEYDLVVTTYSRSVLEVNGYSRIRMNITDILKDFCVLLNLYSKSGSHESQFYLIGVRKKCFTEAMEFSVANDGPQMITHMDNACFGDKNDKVILDLKISFLERSSVRTIQYFSSHIQNIKHELRRMIMDKLNISYLRINLIKFDFFDEYTIMAKVEIVESFVTYSKTKIQGTSHRFRIKSTESGLYSSVIDECVRHEGSKAENKFIISCETGNFCLGIDHEKSLPDRGENGLNCVLFNNSDRSLTKLFADVSLSEIRKSYYNLNGSLFYYFNGAHLVVYLRNVSPEEAASNIQAVSSKYFSLFSIFLVLITIIFCLIVIIFYQLGQPKTYALVDSVSLRAFNSRE